MKHKIVARLFALFATVMFLIVGNDTAQAQASSQKPNIVMLMTDDTGWGDFGVYWGGGAGLGHPTRTSIVLRRKVRSSPIGMDRRAAQQGRLVHHWAHSHSYGTFDRGCSR